MKKDAPTENNNGSAQDTHDYMPHIRHSEYFHQKIDFSGLQFGCRIRPSDIDGVIDFAGRLMVFVEAKFEGYPEVPDGQRILLEHLCDGYHDPNAGRFAIAFVVLQDGQGNITAVKEIRWQGVWRPPKHPIQLGPAISAVGVACLRSDWSKFRLVPSVKSRWWGRNNG